GATAVRRRALVAPIGMIRGQASAEFLTRPVPAFRLCPSSFLGAPRLAWSRHFPRSAAGRLRCLRRLLPVVLLAAQALGRRLPPLADGLLRLFGRAIGLVGLGVWIILAADELDLRHVRAVTATKADAQQAGVAARPRLEAGWNLLEQLADDGAVLDVLEDEPPRREQAAVDVAGRETALGDGDQPLDERTQLLGFRHRRLNPLVTDERGGLVPQERDPVFGDAAQFPMCNLVTHLLYLSLMPELKLGPTCYHVPTSYH